MDLVAVAADPNLYLCKDDDEFKVEDFVESKFPHNVAKQPFIWWLCDMDNSVGKWVGLTLYFAVVFGTVGIAMACDRIYEDEIYRHLNIKCDAHIKKLAQRKEWAKDKTIEDLVKEGIRLVHKDDRGMFNGSQFVTNCVLPSSAQKAQEVFSNLLGDYTRLCNDDRKGNKVDDAYKRLEVFGRVYPSLAAEVPDHVVAEVAGR